MIEVICVLALAVAMGAQALVTRVAYSKGRADGVREAFDRAKRFTANAMIAFLALSAVAVAAPPCNNGQCNVAAVNTSSVFLQTGYPGYVLYQPPQVSYSGGAVGATYDQTKHAKVEAELAEVKAMLRALAEKGLADGTVSAKAFAEASQPMINKYCVGCHRVAEPNVGKGFPLTDIASLTASQRIRILELVMSEDPAEQMPKPNSPQRKEWNGEDAGKLMREVTSIKSRPTENVPVSSTKSTDGYAIETPDAIEISPGGLASRLDKALELHRKTGKPLVFGIAEKQ